MILFTNIKRPKTNQLKIKINEMKFELFLVIFVGFGFEGIKTLDWFNVKTLLNDSTATITPTLTPTLTPTPTLTLTPTISLSLSLSASNTITPTKTVTSCTIQFPTTTLICPDRAEGCKNCKDNQMCVQVGKVDDGTYKCPQFECQDCPEPVCNPTCGCKEECVISRKCKKNQCPIAKCRALPTCLSCPPISCDSVKCENNFECKIKPGSCDVCPSVTCEPKPCIECPTEPITCLCPRGKQCKVIEGSCYKCQSTICVDISDPCADCKGECAVTPHPNCENCPPQRVCVERCRKFSPFLPSWKCNDPRNALYISRTCTTCSEYRCLNGNYIND